jgi:guanyl-specific ribonuclease Sa
MMVSWVIRRGRENIATFRFQRQLRMPNRLSNQKLGRYDSWLRAVAVAAFVALAAYSAWQRQRDLGQDAKPTTAPTEQPSVHAAAEPDPNQRSHSTVIAHQTIRDQDGHVVFRGDVDLGATLERIKRGERLSFSHDGTVFQNRERRLPQEPSGYYHEFVHLTPGISGPGPQRIIIGRDGETYYTPDQYRTFKRLDE